MNNYYETVLILNPEIDDEKKEKLFEVIKKIFKRFKGELISVDEWGKKRLAYPIKKVREGCYILLQHTISVEGLREFERRLKLHDQVMRFQTFRIKKTDIEVKQVEDKAEVKDEGKVVKGDVTGTEKEDIKEVAKDA